MKYSSVFQEAWKAPICFTSFYRCAALFSCLGPPKIDTRYQDKPLCFSRTPVAELSSIWSGQIILPYDIPYDVISMRVNSWMSTGKNLVLNENISWIFKGGCRAIQNEKLLDIFHIASIVLNVYEKSLFLWENIYF